LSSLSSTPQSKIRENKRKMKENKIETNPLSIKIAESGLRFSLFSYSHFYFFFDLFSFFYF